jgi:spore germination cell wall hydrolase CwlJ-like protein
MSQNCDVPRGKVRRSWLAAVALAVSAGLAACSPSGGFAPTHRGPSFATVETLPREADPALFRLSARVSDPRQADVGVQETGWRILDLAHPPNLGLGALDDEAARRVNRFIPVLGASTAPAAPFFLHANGPERDRAMLCLTQAIYYEAALEPDAGQAAVAQTVLNRVRHPAFPHSICGVVYQGVELGIGCQFTFVCDGALSRRPMDALWRRASNAAERAVNGYVMPSVGSATHYHADYVFPRWAPTLVKIGQIGAHIFYRFPGPAGLPGALHHAYQADELRVAMSGRPAAAITLVDTIAAPPQSYIYINPRAVQPQRRPAVGTVLFGRRFPSRDEIDKINAALLEMEKKSSALAAASARAPEPTS